MVRRLGVIALFFWGASSLPAGRAAALAPGSIAVIGFHSDVEDAFAWVPLLDLPEGQQVLFTDAGWFGGEGGGGAFGGAMTVSDGALAFTAPPGGLAAGRVQLVVLEGGAPPPGYERVSAGALGPELTPGSFGDQLAVFTGAPSSPGFVFALSTNASRWGVSSPPNFAAESELYPGLVTGVTAVALGTGANPGDEVDNAYYVGPTQGTAAELLEALADPARWTSSDEPIPDITNGALAAGFQVVTGTLFRRADTDEDGLENLTDVVRILDYLFTGRARIGCLDAADVNDDGRANIADPIYLLGHLFLGGPPPGAPLKACGVDVTVDALGCARYASCP